MKRSRIYLVVGLFMFIFILYIRLMGIENLYFQLREYWQPKVRLVRVIPSPSGNFEAAIFKVEPFRSRQKEFFGVSIGVSGAFERLTSVGQVYYNYKTNSISPEQLVWKGEDEILIHRRPADVILYYDSDVTVGLSTGANVKIGVSKRTIHIYFDTDYEHFNNGELRNWIDAKGNL